MGIHVMNQTTARVGYKFRYLTIYKNLFKSR